MSWTFNPASWVDGTTIPHASDFVDIAGDMSTWGGTVGASAYGLTGLGYLLLKPKELPGTTHTVTTASWSASVATYTVAAHTLAVGQLVSVSGVTPTGYNISLLPITAVGGTTTFSVAQPTNPGTWTSGGTSQADGVSAANGMFALDASNNFNLYYSGSWHVIS
jgi:hypothetical protein